MNTYVLLAISFIWLIGLTIYLLKLRRFYEKILIGKKAKTLEEVINKIIKELESEKLERTELEKKVSAILQETKTHIKYAHFMRFNPFKEVTEGQSFVLVLLDSRKNGVILNFIYSHNQYRIYPKIIKKGKGENVELTEEEKKAINSALKNDGEN